MSTQVTVFDGSHAATALQKLSGDVGAGKPFLRFSKAGEWTYGIEETEVSPTERLAVNPASIQLGYIAWHEQEATEQMAYIAETGINEADLPDIPTDIDENTGKPKGWQQQRGIDFRQLGGGQVEMLFKTSSQGGKEAIAKLVQAMVHQQQTNPESPYPVVCLKTTSYKHKKYGKIFKPVIEIVDWVADYRQTASAPQAASLLD